MAMRRQINAWREEHGLPSLIFGKTGKAQPLVASGPASSPLMQKHVVMCERHPMERLRVFCKNCDRAVCTLCAIDIDICKPHDTKVIDDLLGNLKTEREEWAHACEECRRDAEQLCSAIQANADAKKQTIDTETAVLQQLVRAAADERAAALGAIVQKREEREELVAGAAASPQLAVKGSPASAIVASALNRAKYRVPSASAAEFVPAAAPEAAVGHLALAPPVVDPEDAAVIAAAAEAAAAAAYLSRYAAPGKHVVSVYYNPQNVKYLQPQPQNPMRQPEPGCLCMHCSSVLADSCASIS
jgi:hypothetical protein